ncbi:hypothetical protein [uncultured Arcticibacterium sp.]|uniref:hypothetical protein n=1 Tax=uncultured Arcticibacterium sp. TaxID=2173042 RepID=UPI0030F8B6AE
MVGKISSNEYSNFIAALFANIGFSLFAFFGISSITTDNLIILLFLLVIEVCFIFLTKKILKRVSLEIFLVNDELSVLRYNYKHTIPVKKIRKIKLEHGNIGNSRRYRIEYLDDEHQFNSLFFYVARWNTEFEKFIEFVEENNPYVKIERYSMPWE